MKPGTSDYEARMDAASAKLGIPLKRHTQDKANGPCPWCGGKDRFIVWVDEGNYWCSRCKRSGFWDESADSEAIAEARIRKEERKRSSRQAMAGNTDWVEYHNLLQGGVKKQLWIDEGMLEADIEKWGLGWCPSCPTLPERESLTIPVFFQGVLVDIRHKLLGELDPDVGKYRSHALGVIPFPFNLDVIYTSPRLLVVEGEKKPIHIIRSGLEGVLGVPGANLTEDLLLHTRDLEPSQTVTLAFDPGASSHAEALANDLLRQGVRVYVADCFAKPDDLVLKYGREVLDEVIAQAQLWR